MSPSTDGRATPRRRGRKQKARRGSSPLAPDAIELGALGKMDQLGLAVQRGERELQDARKLTTYVKTADSGYEPAADIIERCEKAGRTPPSCAFVGSHWHYKKEVDKHGGPFRVEIDIADTAAAKDAATQTKPQMETKPSRAGPVRSACPDCGCTRSCACAPALKYQRTIL